MKPFFQLLCQRITNMISWGRYQVIPEILPLHTAQEVYQGLYSKQLGHLDQHCQFWSFHQIHLFIGIAQCRRMVRSV